MLYIGKDFIDDMYSTKMLYMRTKYNAKMYNMPQLYLSDNEEKILKNRFSLIENEVRNISHTYQKEHLVDFYADALNITPHYLTLIVKRLTNQTVSDIVFQLILVKPNFYYKIPILPFNRL